MTPEISRLPAGQPQAGTEPSAVARPAAAQSASAPVQTAPREAGLSSVQFMPDPDSSRMIVKVVNPSTGELLRQIPSEDALALARALGKLQGAFLQQKA